MKYEVSIVVRRVIEATDEDQAYQIARIELDADLDNGTGEAVEVRKLSGVEEIMAVVRNP